MFSKMSIGLVLLAALAAGTFGLTSSNATPTAKSGCCSSRNATCNKGACCEGCPDCKCEKECCTDCENGCKCQCDSQDAEKIDVIKVE